MVFGLPSSFQTLNLVYYMLHSRMVYYGHLVVALYDVSDHRIATLNKLCVFIFGEQLDIYIREKAMGVGIGVGKEDREDREDREE